MKHLFLIALSLLIFSGLQAQEVTFTHGCNFASDKTAGTYTLFPPTAEAEKIIDEILKTVLQTERPFTLNISSEIENAQATLSDDVRYVLYSKTFMDEFKKDPKAKWAAYFVFAHEVGHHVNLHNLNEEDPKKRRASELAADGFATRVLRKLGATCDEAKAALNSMKAEMDKHPSPNYPTFSARQQAVSANCEEKESTRIRMSPETYNKWNLITPGKVIGQQEEGQIVIYAELPQKFIGKSVEVVLCPTDPSIKIQNAKGVGYTTVGSDKKIKITWNYKADKVQEVNATKPEMLKVFVYALYNKPSATISPQVLPKIGTLAGTGLLAVGTGAFFYLKAKKQHRDIYLPNTELDAPIFTENGATDRADFYQKINKKSKNGQYALIGGGILLGTGIVWALKNKSRNKKAYQKAVCQNLNLQSLEPMLASNGTMGLGFKFSF
jgi:hypothetical protein